MRAAVAGRSMRTCLGDHDETIEALRLGRTGAGPVRIGDPGRLNVTTGYHIDGDADTPRRATGWLVTCVTEALRDAGVDPDTGNVVVVVGTGLRELRDVERQHADGGPAVRAADLHFRSALRTAIPAVREVHTLANACAASGYALALACDLLELGEADTVVAAGCDTMTESMLAVIGRVGGEPADMVRPFDVARGGALLGEGAAAVVLRRSGPAYATVRGIGLTCDAKHETAPDGGGIVAAMAGAHARAGVTPTDVDLVVAHATGTALNDPTESAALAETFPWRRPRITAIKGATGHTSGSAFLMNLLVASDALTAGRIPPVVGLDEPIPEARELDLVRGGPVREPVALAQVNAFGFGGVNAVAVVEPGK